MVDPFGDMFNDMFNGIFGGKEVKKEDNKVEQQPESITVLKEKYKNLMKEFENFRNRTEREKTDLVERANLELIKKMLNIMDAFEMAIAGVGNDMDNSIILIYKMLKILLEKEGIEEINPIGLKFDPNFHEAISQVEVENPDRKGNIYKVYQNGYKFKGKVIRYAKVEVVV